MGDQGAGRGVLSSVCNPRWLSRHPWSMSLIGTF